MTELATRPSARLVILNERGECFLFHHQDQPGSIARPLRRYWVLPGGGVDPGETWEQAALRELWEETGITGIPLGPWLWNREKTGLFAGSTVRHIERYYLVRVTGNAIDVTNQFEYERAVDREHRWWALDDLRATTDTVYPEGLAGFLEPIVRGRLPATPIAISLPGT